MKSKTFSYAAWTFIWGFIIYFIYQRALPYFNPEYPHYTPAFSRFTPLLILHITGGMIALLIGPFQFSDLRMDRPRLHRTLGKIYLLSVLISALFSAYLSIADLILDRKWFTFGTGLLGLALAWLITSGMAFFAIKNRNISQHKEWMIRSYVVTFGFVTFRIISTSLESIQRFSFKDEIGNVASWACWSIPLLVTEWILQAKKIKQKSTTSIATSVESEK
jgi:uncharacterized membrane protein